MSVNALVGCYYISWIIPVSFYSLLHRAAFNRAPVVIPGNKHMILYGHYDINMHCRLVLILAAVLIDQVMARNFLTVVKLIFSINLVHLAYDPKHKYVTKHCMNIYLGFGLFFTIFFPYFLHLYPSSSISISDFVLKATLSLASFFSRPSSPSPK